MREDRALLDGSGVAFWDMADMVVVPRMARRKNLECGDKSRAVRGSRLRFLSALCAETHLVPTLSRTHLVDCASDEVFWTAKCRDEVCLAVPLLRTTQPPCPCAKSGVARNTACRRTPDFLV
jgi:hypothetical protein